MIATSIEPLLARLRDELARLPQVEAVAFGGSRARDRVVADDLSDVDLYVFTRGEIPLASRRALVERAGGSGPFELDQRFWGLSDQWRDAATGLHVDVNVFEAGWMQDAIARVLHRHQASLGYTTCFWRTIRQSVPLFDRESWLGELKTRCDVPYPEELRRAIVALNHPVLRTITTSYANQIDKAVARADAVSVHHRAAALLASVFDCLFAANRVPHPGEKRLLEFAVAECPWRPASLVEDVHALLHAAGADPAGIARPVTSLLDGLDATLAEAGLEPPCR